MTEIYNSFNISNKQVKDIVKEVYQMDCTIYPLDGEIDFNYKIETPKNNYVLKISRPNADSHSIDYQQKIMEHISTNPIHSPKMILNAKGQYVSNIKDSSGNIRLIRMISWMPGRIWSSVNPQLNPLLFSLGKESAKLSRALQGFDHPFAKRELEWDIAQSHWTINHLHLFNKEERQIVEYFQNQFKIIQPLYNQLRKSVIHNDINDHNILVTEDLINPKVHAIIDYGDSLHTQIINELAICIAYAVMNKAHTLEAALPVVKGFHSEYQLTEDELSVLYTLVAMRLVISVTKSALNKVKEPDNKYLLISEKPAWKVLKDWIKFDKNYAHYAFREACGYHAHPNENKFTEWAKQNRFTLTNLFPSIHKNEVHTIDLDMDSLWLGQESEFNHIPSFQFKLDQLQEQQPEKILAGGYLECRPIYTSDSYKVKSNSKDDLRTVHLGIDFWLPANTPIHALINGEVVVSKEIKEDKNYGGLVILKHEIDDFCFFTLYGHNNMHSVQELHIGQTIKKGEKIAELGNPDENGAWASHAHFQIMLNLLNFKNDFPGVCIPKEIKVWSSLCPDPNLLFKINNLKTRESTSKEELLNFRQEHLGKSLSLQYQNPLRIVRGKGVYLIDNQGQRYLDTVNNVAHVGHENPNVVKAGQKQMAILNTNTRYLNENINIFAKTLLKSFPKELSFVHFVNSGSEANELALRMAKTYSKQKDIIAVEMGYHGNTGSCIDISSYKFDGQGESGAPEFTHIVPLPNIFRGKYQGLDKGSKYAEHIKEKIKYIESKGRKVAGFICESIISCGGQIELPKNYLKLAYEYVRNAGGLCIADEVQVGCGRVGKYFWGFELHNVVPDIVTIGKPIGNGHPLAAVVCKPKVAEAFANGMEYFNTYGGNPVSCVIGKEVLDIINREKLMKNALEVGEYLKLQLWKLSKKCPIIADVRGQGLFLGFELADKDKNPLTEKTNYLINRMKSYGILMSSDGKYNNVIKIKPPIVFSRQNAKELINKLSTVFEEDFMKYSS